MDRLFWRRSAYKTYIRSSAVLPKPSLVYTGYFHVRDVGREPVLRLLSCERNSHHALFRLGDAQQPDRYRRYDWWGAALGMDVGAGSVVLLAYNPEDAHLYKVR